MASSNRHWPSMFKSKPCNTHHQWQHDINHSLSCHRTTPYSSVGGYEERSPEPKPRWNPKPEQIRILEAIFNSGMVNPPRDEIRKIRAQLQEFGQVGDANVFYWFQNRKSRSKHKLRHHLHASKHQTNPSPSPPPPPPQPKPVSEGSSATAAAPSSSSSSSDKSTNMIGFGRESASNAEALIRHSPGGSVNQQSFVGGGGGVQDHHQYPIFFPSFDGQSSTFTHPTQGLSFAHHDIMVQSNSDDHSLGMNNGPCTNLLLSEIMSHHHRHHGSPKKDVNHGQNSLLTAMATTTTATTVTTSCMPPVAISTGIACADVSVPPISPVISHILGGVGGEAKTTVFINDVAFEVPAGPFNVREAFGEEAVLINSYGHPVLTNQWGLTLHSLHHGAFYYLI